MNLGNEILRGVEQVERRVRYWMRGAPIPPPELHFLVSGNVQLNEEDFLEIGRGCAQAVRQTLTRNGVDLDQLHAVLDFGCGCGRVIRHMTGLRRAKLYGTDYNPRLIAWCQENLPFARFGVNRIAPPLTYGDSQFDLVYAFSVFTHLTEELQLAWITELSRVLKTGGYLHLTTCGESYAEHYLHPMEKACFQEGQVVVRDEKVAGSGRCMAFDPPQYVRETLAKGFEVLEFIPGEVRDIERLLIAQDTFLLRKS